MTTYIKNNLNRVDSIGDWVNDVQPNKTELESKGYLQQTINFVDGDGSVEEPIMVIENSYDENKVTDSQKLHQSNLNSIKNEKFTNYVKHIRKQAKCKVCGDTGWHLIEDLDKKKQPDGKLFIQQAAPTRIRCTQCNIVDEDAKTFENFFAILDWQKTVKAKATDFVDSFTKTGNWFYIGGQVGGGKSHIIEAIGHKISKVYNHQIITINFQQEATELKGMINTPGYMGRINQLQRAKTLIIDDLFESTNDKVPTEADVKIAKLIIDYRYDKNLTMIFSSEFNLNEMIEKIDGGLSSRIYEKTDQGKYYFTIAEDPKNNMRVYLKELIKSKRKGN